MDKLTRGIEPVDINFHLEKNQNWIGKKSISGHIDAFENSSDPQHIKLEQHTTLLLHAFKNGTLEDSARVMRSLVKLPGGRQEAARLLLSHEPKITDANAAHQGVLAAIAGDFVRFNECLTKNPKSISGSLGFKIDGENLLHLACQGGDPKIIEEVAKCMGSNALFKKSGSAGKAPIDYLKDSPQMLAAHKAVFNACLRDGNLENSVEATRRLKQLPGGKDYISGELKKNNSFNKNNAERCAAMAALVGEKEVFDKAVSDYNLYFPVNKQRLVYEKSSTGFLRPETMLHWACEGGNAEIINAVIEKTGKSILESSRFGKAPVENLNPAAYSVLISGFDKKPPEEQVKALRALLKLPGGKEFLQAKVGEYKSKESIGNNASRIAAMAVLAGNSNVFDLCLEEQNTIHNLQFGRENLLHLACQGGNPDIIANLASQAHARNDKNPFLEKTWSLVGTRPIDYLDKAVLEQKFNFNGSELTLRTLYDENYKSKSGKTLEQEMQSVRLPSPIKAVVKAAALYKAGYERKARLGSDTVEGEQRMSLLSYEDSKAAYAELKNNTTLSIEDRNNFEAELKNNTFNFLGGLITNGEFDLAKSVIVDGLFNEVSPRMLSMLSASPFSTKQQFELCEAFLKHANVKNDIDSQVMLARHLGVIPGGKEKANEMLNNLYTAWQEKPTTPVKQSLLYLSALLGNIEKFNLLNNDIGSIHARTATGQTLMHFACEGNNVDIIKACADKMDKDPNPFLVKDRPASFWGRRLKTRNRPIDMMTAQTANALDAAYKYDPNKPGSFSMAVSRTLFVRTPIKWSYTIAASLGGKFGGDILASAAMSTIESIGTLGMGSGAVRMASHAVALSAETAALNAPVYGGAAVGALGNYKLFRGFIRRVQAEGKGLDDSLSQFKLRESTLGEKAIKGVAHFVQGVKSKVSEVDKTPAEVLGTLGNESTVRISQKLIRQLARVPQIDFEKRTQILSGLITRTTDDALKPDDGNKMVESLLESQLQLGHDSAVRAAIQQHLDNIENPPSLGKLRSYMLAAARMGDITLLHHIAAKNKDPDSLWLDTFARSDIPSVFGLPQLDRGNTLMHIAVATGDVKFILSVDSKIREAYDNRQRVQAPGQDVTHRLPTTRMRDRAFAESAGSGRMNAQLSDNPYSIRNAAGQTASELLSLPVARALDEAYKLDPSKPGSLTQVTLERVAFQNDLLGAELGMVLPGKIALNIAVTHAVMATVMAGKALGAAHGGPVGAMLGGAITDFVVGTGVMLVGGAGGFLSGTGAMKGMQALEQKMRGYGTEASQLTPQMLESAKADLQEFCKNMPGVNETKAFEREIKSRQDLTNILLELNKTQGFSEAFGNKLSRVNLVRAGEITQAFSDALDKAAPTETAVSEELTEFAGKSFGERKQALNTTSRSANFELLKKIDRYLDSGQTFSDQQLKNLQAAFQN